MPWQFVAAYVVRPSPHCILPLIHATRLLMKHLGRPAGRLAFSVPIRIVSPSSGSIGPTADPFASCRRLRGRTGP